MTAHPPDHAAALEAIAQRLDRAAGGAPHPDAASDARACRAAARYLSRVRSIWRSDVPCPTCRQPLITDGRVHWCATAGCAGIAITTPEEPCP